MFSSGSVAAALVALPNRDDAPRVIQQFTSIFLVSRFGELWRVYDCETPEGGDRAMPSARSTHTHRIFVALARRNELRVHTFAPGESRELDPDSLQRQLDDTVAV
jgi:transcription initiation factor TFIIIB Brf1 subunit/transcription initiation factor TFIIB